MDKRKRITLLYNFSEEWIGGTYYILNIIRSLNYLEDVKKPKLVILHDVSSSLAALKEIKYPYIEYKAFSFKLGFIERVVNKICYYLNGEIFFKKYLPSEVTHNIYPLTRYISSKNVLNGYYWIPDFQDKYMPQLFPSREVIVRAKSHRRFIKDNVKIVFSSNTSKCDFDKFYPDNGNEKKVLRFASIVEKSYDSINFSELCLKYNISKPYFIVPNQFWQHKNHQVVLDAVKLLNEKGVDIQVVFTGKEHDYRNPNHVNQLKRFIKDNKIEDKILFLGFIAREEQLQLMNKSIAIIQPSLFEGWSTVVEDAKVLNHFILVSDIPIHREQVHLNCDFFDPKNPYDLSEKLLFLLSNKVEPSSQNYDEFIVEFANNFLDLF